MPTPHEYQQQQQQQQHQRQKQQQQQQQHEQQQQEESQNFLEKVGQQIFSSFKRIGGFLNPPSPTSSPKNDDSTKISEKRGEVDSTSKQNFIPIMVAGVAAVALGGLALFGTPPSVATVNSGKDELIYQRKRSHEVMRSLDSAKEVYED